MTKPFYQLALMTIENPHVKDETIKHSIFKKQFNTLILLLQKIHEVEVRASKAQLQLRLGSDFEWFLKILVTAENAFWYQYLLKTQLPELYARMITTVPSCDGIEIDDKFMPKLLYNEMKAADRRKPDTKVSEFIYACYNIMYWSESTISRIQTLEKASQSNLKLVSAIEQCSGKSDLKILEQKLRGNLLLLTKGK